MDQEIRDMEIIN
jgi:hypothetical protein